MADDKRTVTVHSTRTAYKGRYEIETADFSFDKVSGEGRIEHAQREVFKRGDSAAALIHDIERDVIIVIEQFRYAAYAAGPGYMLEAMAGSIDKDEDPADCIKREMMEETGYKAGQLTRIARYYVSPGAASERLYLYYAPVTPADLANPKASGLAEEGEDIRRVEISREDFLMKLDAGDFDDGKLVAAGLWLKSRPGQGKPRKKAATP